MLRFLTKAAPKLKTPRPLKPNTAEDCPFCRTEKDRGIALYRLKTSSTKVVLILGLMADGVDVSALERVFGIREGTLRTWLTRAGLQAGKVHRHFFHHLILHHLQLDELWSQVRQGNRVVWVWTVVEASSTLVPVLKLGPHSMDLAYAVVHDLCQMLQPGYFPIFTNDGLKLYFHALTAHFGCWQLSEGNRKPVGEIPSAFLYAQLKKIHCRRRSVRVERRMLCGELEYLKDGLQALGFSGKINTAFIERFNLTLRQGVSFLARRTWGMAQSTPELEVSLEWWRAYYHYVRYHEGLRVKLSQPLARKGK